MAVSQSYSFLALSAQNVGLPPLFLIPEVSSDHILGLNKGLGPTALPQEAQMAKALSKR
jgi:hypothetical protein